VRRLPPPAAPEALPDLGEGFPAEARRAIEAGEHALIDLRENTAHSWYLVGGACFMLRNVALNRSGANQPAGKRYNRIYAVLTSSWPELGKLDKATRSHAIWLFEHYDAVKAWLATLPQNQRDQWVYPGTVRRHFEKRHPQLMSDREPRARPPRLRCKHEWNKQMLGERSREDLEKLVGELAKQVADRDRHILELEDIIEQKDREMVQLRQDLAWETTARKQLEPTATPPAAATVVRPDGEDVEVVHALSRASQEIGAANEARRPGLSGLGAARRAPDEETQRG
jgi:hypothetical protein